MSKSIIYNEDARKSLKDGVDTNTDSPIRIDSSKPAEPLRETERKKDPEEEFDIQFIIPGEENFDMGQTVPQDLHENNQRSQLNPKYTFENFIVGQSNKFAKVFNNMDDLIKKR